MTAVSLHTVEYLNSQKERSPEWIFVFKVLPKDLAEKRELTTRLGITSVFVTHDQTEIMSMSDKIAVLSGGVVKQYDSPDAIYSAPKTEFVARFAGASNWIDGHHTFRPKKASLQFTERPNGLTHRFCPRNSWAVPISFI